LKEAEMQRRELIRILEEAGFISKGGTNHEKFVKGDKLVLVKRHREIEEQIAKRILRQAGLR
jgi:predicted RNA binding protein YcfA (HicA-like mRNA interferase family)